MAESPGSMDLQEDVPALVPWADDDEEFEDQPPPLELACPTPSGKTGLLAFSETLVDTAESSARARRERREEEVQLLREESRRAALFVAWLQTHLATRALPTLIKTIRPTADLRRGERWPQMEPHFSPRVFFSGAPIVSYDTSCTWVLPPACKLFIPTAVCAEYADAEHIWRAPQVRSKL
ncbi:hypothetical protein DFH06DRAFT_1120443 [Mycena polygramma]|nr:hypothetical protein DFH06DRAFT_1120443 [Mycena polygramma]